MNNTIFEKLVNLKNKKIYVIAEMSGNHQNSLEVAKMFIHEAIENRADIIKFQVYKPETITFNSNNKDFRVDKDSLWNDYNNLFELYEKAHTPWNWIKELASILDKKKFPWFASPFDKTAVDFLESINCQAYKLASPEITDIGLIEYISKTKKPIVLSTGVATEIDLDLAISTLKKSHSKFAILKCTSAYPTPVSDLNLNAIPALKKKYNCPIGFSDHTIGFDSAKTAIALGSTIIEKHFKIDSDTNSVDEHFSAKLSDLKKFKTEIETIVESLGKSTLEIESSVKGSLSGRRSLYVIKDVQKGEKFTLDNIRSIRPSFGLHPKYLNEVIEKKATKNIKSGSRLEECLIQGFKI